jgi:hypothetical protein
MVRRGFGLVDQGGSAALDLGRARPAGPRGLRRDRRGHPRRPRRRHHGRAHLPGSTSRASPARTSSATTSVSRAPPTGRRAPSERAPEAPAVATSTPPTAPRAQRPLEGLDLLDEVDLLPVRFLDPAAWAVTSILAREEEGVIERPEGLAGLLPVGGLPDELPDEVRDGLGLGGHLTATRCSPRRPRGRAPRGRAPWGTPPRPTEGRVCHLSILHDIR